MIFQEKWNRPIRVGQDITFNILPIFLVQIKINKKASRPGVATKKITMARFATLSDADVKGIILEKDSDETKKKPTYHGTS